MVFPAAGTGPASAAFPSPGQDEPLRRRIGVLGTLIWDRIVDVDGRRPPVEEWGGVAYGLEALSAALPEGWTVRPILKLGLDLSERALAYLASIPHLEPEGGVEWVPHPTTRVELWYRGSERRTERLQGGPPPWTWEELGPKVQGLDALYVNFISGFEMALDTALTLRAAFPGPIYADLHSLFLGITGMGFRVPRELPGWGAWLRAFDAVQMNEAEFELLGRAWGDPWRLAAEVVGPEVKLMAVTLGREGAAYIAAPDFDPQPLGWRRTRGQVARLGPVLTGKVPPAYVVEEGDPTGCGDVWGATFFGRLLAGAPLMEAMEAANLSAARNAQRRGATGLHRYLKGMVEGS